MPIFLGMICFLFKEKDKKISSNKKQPFAENYKNERIRENIIMMVTENAMCAAAQRRPKSIMKSVLCAEKNSLWEWITE